VALLTDQISLLVYQETLKVFYYQRKILRSYSIDNHQELFKQIYIRITEQNSVQSFPPLVFAIAMSLSIIIKSLTQEGLNLEEILPVGSCLLNRALYYAQQEIANNYQVQTGSNEGSSASKR